MENQDLQRRSERLIEKSRYLQRKARSLCKSSNQLYKDTSELANDFDENLIILRNFCERLGKLEENPFPKLSKI